MRGSQGARFGPYELIRRLGAGGMAETFLAVRRGPGGFEQRVCIKRILPAFEEDEDFVRQFLHEARLSARLRHTNIVQVMDFGVHEGFHYLALELVEGLDLRGLFKALHRAGEPLPFTITHHLALEMAAALEHAHTHDVVHRDISPSNVLLSTAGEVKLSDFGIARAMDQQSVTQTGIVKGKVPYMAPEYANRGLLDARSDLFALGVVLFECVAGRRPYDGPTDLETVARGTMGAHTPLAELSPGAPECLVMAVERLIRPEPEDRFPSASDLLDALASEPSAPRARRDLGLLVRRHAAPPEATPGPAPLEGRSDAAGTDALDGIMSGDPTDTLGLATTQPDRPRDHEATRTEWMPEPTPAPEDVAGPHDVTRTARRPAHPAATPPPRTTRAKWATGVAVLSATALAAFVWAPGGSAPTPPTPTAGEPSRPGTHAPSAEGDLVAHRQQPPSDPPSSGAEEADDGRPDEPHTDDAPPPPQRARAPADAGPSSNPSSTDRRAAAAAPPVPSDPSPRKRPATLHVVVLPFGDVWIDGRHVGPSPARLRVPAGLHTVATGDGAPERSTRVRVAPGERRRIVLE